MKINTYHSIELPNTAYKCCNNHSDWLLYACIILYHKISLVHQSIMYNLYVTSLDYSLILNEVGLILNEDLTKEMIWFLLPMICNSIN